MKAVPILVIVLTAGVGVGLGVAAGARGGRGDGARATATATVGARSAARTSPFCQQLVPAAYGPTVWPASESSAPAPASIIANWGQGYGGAGGGPGRSRSPARLATIRQARAKGIQVLGYVWTDYANNAAGDPAASGMTQAPLPAVKKEAMEWFRWYGVRSLFFDGATTGTGNGQLRYYRHLYKYVHAHIPGAQVWINPGWYPRPSYMSAADVIMDFESSYGILAANPPPAWVHRFPARRFANVLHLPDSKASSLRAALALTRASNAGHVYVADQQSYSALPAYWTAENAGVAGECG